MLQPNKRKEGTLSPPLSRYRGRGIKNNGPEHPVGWLPLLHSWPGGFRRRSVARDRLLSVTERARDPAHYGGPDLSSARRAVRTSARAVSERAIAAASGG